MILIIGVRFRKSGKVYYFDPVGLDIKKNDHVIVETSRGVEYGTVSLPPTEIADNKVVLPLKPVLRIATQKDAKTSRENEEKEREAFQICQEKIWNHGLQMKLIDSEYTFDRSKLLFYFTADGRIDFRELVKDLASVFRTRIELRQIGVRDETKMMGGIAICGRPLCCNTYLPDFVPVSIKMAKEQNLSLNPAKISGVCGRLMCCLKNEQEAYEYLNSTLPNIGTTVTTPEGYSGEVQNVNVLKQRVKVILTLENDEKEVREYPVEELRFRRQYNRSNVGIALPDEQLDENALRELEQMERGDLEDSAVDEAAEKGEWDGQDEWNERGERSRRSERNKRSRRNKRGKRNEQSEWNERSEQNGHGEQNKHSDQNERSEQNKHSEQNERGEWNKRSEQNERGEWNKRSEQNEHGEQNKRSEQNERGEWNKRSEQNEHGEQNKRSEQNERGEQNKHGEQNERGSHQNRKKRGYNNLNNKENGRQKNSFPDEDRKKNYSKKNYNNRNQHMQADSRANNYSAGPNARNGRNNYRTNSKTYHNRNSKG